MKYLVVMLKCGKLLRMVSCWQSFVKMYHLSCNISAKPTGSNKILYLCKLNRLYLTTASGLRREKSEPFCWQYTRQRSYRSPPERTHSAKFTADREEDEEDEDYGEIDFRDGVPLEVSQGPKPGWNTDDSEEEEREEDETDSDYEYDDSDDEDVGDGKARREIWEQIDRGSYGSVASAPEEEFLKWRQFAREREVIETSGVMWGEVTLELTREILLKPKMESLTLHTFKAIPRQRKIVIYIDKYLDIYGSPDAEEIEIFTSMVLEKMRQRLGESVAYGIELEISSPGADREVRLPDELSRFKSLPMMVEYIDERKVSMRRVLDLKDISEKISIWSYHRSNYNQTFEKIKKKDFDKQFEIPIENIKRVSLYMDF